MIDTPTPSPLDEIGSHIRQAWHGEAQAGIGSPNTRAHLEIAPEHFYAVWHYMNSPILRA